MFQTIDFSLRGVYEDVIVEQRMLRSDQHALLFANRDIRRSKKFERWFADTHAPRQFGLQPFGWVTSVVSFWRDRQYQHVPPYRMITPLRADPLGTRTGPSPITTLRIHSSVVFIQGIRIVFGQFNALSAQKQNTLTISKLMVTHAAFVKISNTQLRFGLVCKPTVANVCYFCLRNRTI